MEGWVRMALFMKFLRFDVAPSVSSNRDTKSSTLYVLNKMLLHKVTVEVPNWEELYESDVGLTVKLFNFDPCEDLSHLVDSIGEMPVVLHSSSYIGRDRFRLHVRFHVLSSDLDNTTFFLCVELDGSLKGDSHRECLDRCVSPPFSILSRREMGNKIGPSTVHFFDLMASGKKRLPNLDDIPIPIAPNQVRMTCESLADNIQICIQLYTQLGQMDRMSVMNHLIRKTTTHDHSVLNSWLQIIQLVHSHKTLVGVPTPTDLDAYQNELERIVQQL